MTRIIGVLALLVPLAGCEKSVPRTDYFPLRDGNRWEYRLLDKPLLTRLSANQPIETASLVGAPDESGGHVENELPAKAEIVVDAFTPSSPREASTPVAAARRVVLELRAAVDELTCRAIYDTAEQVWSKRNGYVGFQSIRGRSYLLILPPHTGYKWVVTGAAGQDLFYEIETTAATIATPRQTFQHCVLVRQESRDRREILRYWFAPDVGLVRRSKYFANEEVFRQELVDYMVKPATPATRLAEEHEVRKAIEGKNRGNEFHQRTRDDLRERRFGADTSESDNRSDHIRKYGDPK
ncbi:MAG: hypothetical protein V1899_00480 [Planctomycetota bacterium]